MNHEFQISPDTQAILLLCGYFGKKTDKVIQPLTPAEYAWLAQWLHEQKMRPADLLAPEVAIKLKSISYKKITASRLIALLMRGTAMALAMETWTNQGLWILSRSDKMYPTRLKNRLGHAAPPLFYGAGSQMLLHKGGVAMVGFREVNDWVIDVTKRLAKLSAQQGITVISGGARGVDTEAMLTALAQGRCAVGVLADSLSRAVVNSRYRDALKEERLALISPFDPQVGFNVGNAMARNKYIYTLADWAVVVNSDYEQGGTWAGAVENLRAGWVPLLVWQDENMSIGNQQLLNQGAIPIDKTILQHTADLREQWQRLSNKVSESPGMMSPATIESQTLTETTPTTLPNPVVVSEDSTIPRSKENDGSNHSSTGVSSDKQPIDLFEVIWPYLDVELHLETTESDLAERLNLHPSQLKIWLKRAVEEGKIRKLTKPVRYISVHAVPRSVSVETKQPTLF